MATLCGVQVLGPRAGTPKTGPLFTLSPPPSILPAGQLKFGGLNLASILDLFRSGMISIAVGRSGEVAVVGSKG